MKIIVNNNQLINIINDDLQKNIIKFATYKTLLNENINYEKELIQDIQFLTGLKEELNTNTLKFNNEELYFTIQQKCWRKNISIFHHNLYRWYFDFDLREKLINDYNLSIKNSNQKEQEQVINNNFNSNNKKIEYKNWKRNYFNNINEKFLKNNTEQGIDVFEYFKYEINSNDLQNQTSTTQYKLNVQKEVI